MRLDVYLVKEKYCESRNKSAALICSGNIYVNGVCITKPAFIVGNDDSVTVHIAEKQYVARSAKKLLTAIKNFNVDFIGKTVVDLGASTGGFCQVMLENGAEKVYAVDIGTNQLHHTLKADKRIVSMENTNARYLEKSMFSEEIDVVTCDLSFISLRCILPAAFEILRFGGELICLVKPQFEVGPDYIGKNGVVKDKKLHVKAVCDIADFARSLGLYVKDICFSELAGESGNMEYLLYMQKVFGCNSISDELIADRIQEVK